MSFIRVMAHRAASITALTLLCWSEAARAQTKFEPHPNAPTNAQQTISLAEAQTLAVERNWDLLAAAAGVEAAVAQKIIAREFPNSTLSLSTSKINVDDHPQSSSSGNGIWERSFDTIVAVNQLFEIGGKRRHRRVSAEAGFEAAQAQFQDARRTLQLAVARAYVAAVQAEENVRVLKESAMSLRKEAQLAEIRLKAGEISDADKSRIEIEAAKLELDARTGETAASQARVGLQVLLGERKAEGNIALRDSLELLAAELGETNTVPQTAPRRADIIAAEAALRKTESDVRLQKANRIPDPTVLAQYEHEPPDAPNSVGVGVSFPLPLWNHNRGNVRAAEAAREQARLALQKTEAQAAADITLAHFAYEDAARRWEDYRERIRPKAEQIRKSVAYAYEKGGVSLLDLLQAERNNNEVRLAATQAAGDTIIALAALRAATTQMEQSRKAK